MCTTKQRGGREHLKKALGKKNNEDREFKHIFVCLSNVTGFESQPNPPISSTGSSIRRREGRSLANTCAGHTATQGIDSI